MSNIEINPPEIIATKDDNDENTKNTLDQKQSDKLDNGPSRRLVPMICATLLTLAWTSLCIYFVFLDSGTFVTTSFNLVTVAGLVAGYATPIVIFWLIALVFQRSDPLLERRLAVSQNLDKAIAPVEIAEARLAQLNKHLQKELTNIEAVADLANDRIKNLESAFQEQISNLFSATADTEARTVSIRDTLARERNASDDFASDIENRFKSLETQLSQLSNTLQTTSNQTIENVDQAQSKLNNSVEDLGKAADALETRVNVVSNSMGSRIGEMQDMSVDLELRLETVTGNILGGMERFRHDLENIEGRSAELSDHMRTQATVLGDLAELAAQESNKIEQSLQIHVNEVRSAANEALEKTNDVSLIVSERAQNMSAHVMDAVERAKLLLDEAGNALDKHCESAVATSQRMNANTLTQVQETASTLEKKADEYNDLLNAGLERVRTTLDKFSEDIADQNDTTVQQAEDMAERTLQRIRQLRSGVEEQIQQLEAASTHTSEIMAEHIHTISQNTQNLTEHTGQTHETLSDLENRMSVQSQTISTVLSDAQARLKTLEETLVEQQNNLNTVSHEAANQVIEAAEIFTKQTHSLQSQTNETHASILNDTEHLIVAINDIVAQGETGSNRVNIAAGKLGQESETLRYNLSESSNALGGAAEAFAAERDRIRQESENVVKSLNEASNKMGQEIGRFTENSIDAANKLETASHELMDQTQRAQTDMQHAVNNTKEELTGSIDDISNQANERITYLQDAMQMTLARLLDEYQATADQAEKESALLAMRLGNEAEKIAQRSEQFIEKTAEIEKRITSASKNDFAKTSQLLLESLQSISIDISKALSHDIPDDMWKSYLSGDRSIFTRRTLKLGDRKSRKIIADKFRTDSEFREAVSRYCRDFEGMMERAMMGDKGNAMSVTLVSSDMGKLYVLLGQSLKKFS